MNLSDFAPLAEAGAGRASFFTLQKGPRSEQAANPPVGMQLRDYTGDLNDFEDTAALMTNLDLVISVDTSVVHLAGALAKPVWTLIAIGPDWRWLAEREDSPWYPTMRLFRQTKWKDWAEVMQRVAAALREKLAPQ
jgi:ADP-heptose:LPS heptosyltransferase